MKNQQSKIDFTRQLVKGKIVETLFAQMLRGTGHYTVLEFGYEKIVPELAQSGYKENKETIETLSTSPDFAIINKKTKEVKLIEVKYRRRFDTKNILKSAQRMAKSWNPSYLFLATQDGFYFDEVSKIIKNKGKISPLKNPLIPQKTIDQYLKMLKDFEANN